MSDHRPFVVGGCSESESNRESVEAWIDYRDRLPVPSSRFSSLKSVRIVLGAQQFDFLLEIPDLGIVSDGFSGEFPPFALLALEEEVQELRTSSMRAARIGQHRAEAAPGARRSSALGQRTSRRR